MSNKFKETYALLRKAEQDLDRMDWPGMPNFDDPLYDLVADLMEYKLWNVGYISRVIQSHTLSKKDQAYLNVDHQLTHRFLELESDNKEMYLLYKLQLDYCIMLSKSYLNLLLSVQ